ncbi:hypothetical protein KR100_10355 [Synechococcus sp. KORDI-100]|nr:hypothetical protein KR100_10355 [Synechococcus sp. KORDI-100]
MQGLEPLEGAPAKGEDTLQSKRLIDQQFTPGRDFGLLAPGCCR